jgi:hypothetical protein
MRRILSILLLLVLGFGPDTPATALASGLISGMASGWSGKVDESRLPACCRRNGKHHCAMDSMESQATDSNGVATVSALDSCPFMPHAMASTAPSVAAIVASAANSSALASELRVEHAIVTAAQMSERRSWPQRGPPATQIL